MSSEVVDKLRYLLEATSKVLTDNDIDFWLDRGVLLGAYRNGSLISGDTDIDLRVMHAEWERIEQTLRDQLPDDLRVTAHHHGATIQGPDKDHPFRWFRNADGVFPIAAQEGIAEGLSFHTATALAVSFPDTDWSLKPNLDLYCCRVNRHHDCMPPDSPTPWREDQKRYLCLPARNPHSMLVPFDYVFPLSTISIEGQDYPAPCRTDQYLQHLFGYIGEDAVYDSNSRRWIKSPDGQPAVLDL